MTDNGTQKNTDKAPSVLQEGYDRPRPKKEPPVDVLLKPARPSEKEAARKKG